MSDDDVPSPPMESDGMIHHPKGDSDMNFFDAMEAIYLDDIMQHQELVAAAAAETPTTSSSRSSGGYRVGDDDDDDDDDDDGEFPTKDGTKRTPMTRGDISRRRRLREMAHEQRMKLEGRIRSRRRRLVAMMNEPGFVMTMDKLSFVCGVLIIMIIEAVMLLVPRRMDLLYITLLVPLMIARYVTYRADGQHYFMYDFCYFAQIMLVLQTYAYPNDEKLGRAMFSISNGPLLLAIVMWRNSIVFHSFDKMTSMFIHILPPLVTFCHRWADHLSRGTFPPYESMDGSISDIIGDFWFVPFCYYALWQVAYLAKTEVISKKKLDYNTEMMTSLRFLTRKKNSTSYKLMSAFGEHNQLPTFVLIQAVYTMITLLVSGSV
jgi:hypothetical protein